MISDHFICKKAKVIAMSSLFITTVVFAAPSIQYASPMGEENWRMTGNPLRCGLSLTIPNYGIGYFEQYATQSLTSFCVNGIKFNGPYLLKL
ncbi:hypothetical protein PGH42_10825 [Legionella pneumophila]|nr:hypothetical protein PGH42_10825 [Legionella pneumophila]